jgi:hypothetical protein
MRDSSGLTDLAEGKSENPFFAPINQQLSGQAMTCNP